MSRAPLVAVAAVALSVTTAMACSSESTPTVKVTATDTTCTAVPNQVKSGKVKFELDNQGTVITELYLYASGDRDLDEVENIRPGEKGQFSVSVGGGTYELACKPNQVGDGIRTTFTVTGSPDSRFTAPPDKATARGRAEFAAGVVLDDHGFQAGLSELFVVKGQTVSLHVDNASGSPHGFAVLAPDGSTLGEIPPIAPGASADLKLTFTVLGTYTAIDPTGDFRQQGFQGTFTVIE